MKKLFIGLALLIVGLSSCVPCNTDNKIDQRDQYEIDGYTYNVYILKHDDNAFLILKSTTTSDSKIAIAAIPKDPPIVKEKKKDWEF